MELKRLIEKPRLFFIILLTLIIIGFVLRQHDGYEYYSDIFYEILIFVPVILLPFILTENLNARIALSIVTIIIGTLLTNYIYSTSGFVFLGPIIMVFILIMHLFQEAHLRYFNNKNYRVFVFIIMFLIATWVAFHAYKYHRF